MGRDTSRSSRRSSSRRDRSGNNGTQASQSEQVLADMRELLADVEDTLSVVASNQAALGDVLTEITGSDESIPSRIDRPLVSSKVVSQGEEVSEDVNVPKDGRLTEVYLSFPEGANQSLGIGVKGVDSENLVPFGPKAHNYIALSDTVVQFSLDYRVEKGENLTVDYVNNRNVDEDGFLTAILVVTEDR